MEDNVIIDSESQYVVQLITESEAIAEFKEATSAVSMNPAVSWARFVLTDDLPNANKQRVPAEEFPNLVKTGIFMPIKMAKGEVKDGHEMSEPIGVITNLKIVVNDVAKTNQVIGLAALWSRERPEDVALLKTAASKGTPINLSWEILYRNSTSVDGIEELRDVALRASTVVGKPAYENRTPILAIAAKQLFSDSMDELQAAELDDNTKKALLDRAKSVLEVEAQVKTEENKLDELETIKAELAEIKASLEEAKGLVAEKERLLSEKESELASLREFKASVEAEASKLQKMASIKEKFVSAGVTKDDTYFTEHSDFLVGMTDAALDFMLQEIVSFGKAESSVKVPALSGPPSGTIKDIKQLAQALNEFKVK